MIIPTIGAPKGSWLTTFYDEKEEQTTVTLHAFSGRSSPSGLGGKKEEVVAIVVSDSVVRLTGWADRRMGAASLVDWRAVRIAHPHLWVQTGP